ncbi:MAG: DUF302 domain-containing protein [Kiritimatiellales bacterium]|nr:DUF302 domain-containing protein [Kiritimatiellales bacterium]MCF7863618.1 DUF302 domain-containing protein [Kiritimatiellales bacterium]
MKYVVVTDKSVEQAVADVAAAAKEHQFGVLHIHNLQQTMKNKGVDFANECQILEICNPHKAKAVLMADMSLNMALPCRISVYAENGQTKIGMIKPKAMLAALSDSKELLAVAQEVEDTTIAIINQAK